MARFLGGTFGIALDIAVFAASGNVVSSEAFSTGFVAAISVSAALSLAAAIAALAFPARRERRRRVLRDPSLPSPARGGGTGRGRSIEHRRARRHHAALDDVEARR